MWPCTVGHKVFKALRLVGCQGTVHLLRQHLSLWHKACTTHMKMTLFGHKYRCSAPSVSDLQHLSFLVRSVRVHGCSRWEMIPELTSWHPPCVAVYPPGTFAYISMLLPCVIIFDFYQFTDQIWLVKKLFLLYKDSWETSAVFYPILYEEFLLLLKLQKINHMYALFIVSG